MSKTEMHNHDSGVEPAPRFATEAEITLAEQLRRQLEERYVGRYVGPFAASSPLQARSGEVY